jgi:perosamine synthetase
MASSTHRTHLLDTETPVEIPLSRPDITEAEIAAVVDVLRTPSLSLGPKLTEFEELFAAYIGSKYAVAVNSGTSGLHLTVKTLGIGPDDAVITTPFSFIASANCILYESALPIFIDIESRTFNIDPERVEAFLREDCQRDRKTGRPIHRVSGKVVKAMLPVHVFGHPCDMRRLMALAEEYQLSVIEDACEAIGAELGGRKAGAFGDVSVFAFYPNKQITTGEGGMIVTNDFEIARLCRSMRNQGRDEGGGWLSHTRLGYNYRLSEIHCALGIAQLRRIDEILAARHRVAARYNLALLHDVITPDTAAQVGRSWFVYVVLLPEGFPERDQILQRLSAQRIGCNKYFPPIHLQKLYRDRFGFGAGDFPTTEYVSSRTIALPFHSRLTNTEIDTVVSNLREAMYC